MPYFFMQVNIGVNIASLLGLTYMIFAVAYLITMIVLLSQRSRRLESLPLTIYILQTLIIPIFMLISGVILLFQGWRLDPILQFMQLLLTVLIIYLCIKDIVINAVYRNR